MIFHSPFTIKARLIAVGVLMIISMTIVIAVWSSAFSQYQVNGPVYKNIIKLKDLTADILPPPEYIIEANLVVNRAINGDLKRLPALQTKFAQLHKDYEDRHRYWSEADLPSALRSLMLDESYKPAQQFFSVADADFFPALRDGNVVGARKVLGSMSAAYETHRAAIDKIASTATELAVTAEQDAQANSHSRIVWVAGSCALIVLIMMAALGLTATQISGGLRRFIDGIGEIERNGDLSKRLEVKGQDEIAQAGEAINQMLGNINSVVAAVGDVMKRVANNDLAARVSLDARGDVEQLRLSLNQALDGLSGTLQAIMSNIRQVAAASGEVSTAIGQISDGAQSQLNALKQIASGVTQTAKAAEDVTINARNSSASAREAAGLVQDGRERISSLVEAVTLINGNALAISKITDVIGQIAAQTNMLSLNAAIEAARAGEAGKGFAVVADEVGKLAEHSGRSVSDINQLIGKAGAETSRGVELANNAGASIEAIAKGVNEADRMAGAIAIAMEQQTATVEQIRTSVDQLARIGETNAAASEEVTATMVELSRLADLTRNEIDRFRFAEPVAPANAYTLQAKSETHYSNWQNRAA